MTKIEESLRPPPEHEGKWHHWIDVGKDIYGRNIQPALWAGDH